MGEEATLLFLVEETMRLRVKDTATNKPTRTDTNTNTEETIIQYTTTKSMGNGSGLKTSEGWSVDYLYGIYQVSTPLVVWTHLFARHPNSLRFPLPRFTRYSPYRTIDVSCPRVGANATAPHSVPTARRILSFSLAPAALGSYIFQSTRVDCRSVETDRN
ncbi:hypothetical protein AG1IA_01917 [Rhizoctonia solani AG-1 IA]|uniref:Uncharacterized protein n=1 Tax=Thanatephorus cucumeris (strain AG1-IA) TaxID=983506 RepID=L8X4U4_THACA|nr:hypothetical protein AG1IA_01917 [Rhizoctonia solani AG-1 IA]